MRIFPAVVFLAATAALPALAADEGLYLRGQAGWSWARDAGISDSRPLGSSDDVLVGELNDVGSSSLFGIALGYRVHPMFRLEIGASHRAGYELDDHDSGNRTGRQRSDVRSTAVLVTGFFEPFRFGPWTPFVGAGAGASYNRVSGSRSTDSRLSGVSVSGPGGDRLQAAWLATGGISLALTPELRIELAYQYFDAGGIRTDRGTYSDSRGRAFSYVGAETSGDLAAHEVVIGVRYSF